MVTHRQAAFMRKLFAQTAGLALYCPSGQKAPPAGGSMRYPIKRGASQNRSRHIEVAAGREGEVSVVFLGVDAKTKNEFVIKQRLDVPIDDVAKFIFDETGLNSLSPDIERREATSRAYRMSRW